LRHPAITDTAVYAIPDPVTGDQVMAAVVTNETPLDLAELGRFLAGQADLGPKQVPRYVRVVRELPRTSTFKILERRLSAEALDCPDVAWKRAGREITYTVMSSRRADRP
jgi:fatty-acyl-CoA synthase